MKNYHFLLAANLSVLISVTGCGSSDSSSTNSNSGGSGIGSSGGATGSSGGATGSSGGTTGNSSGVTGGVGIIPANCGSLPPAPVDFETLEGFTSSEDFVFDAEGNYVGVDENQNLVRISKSGKSQLWVPSLGTTIAGMAILADGSVVMSDVDNGAIKRVHPNGASTVVLAGLLYPNGLDIGPDGFIYVAENYAGRVRRINPENGEYSIVALGLHGPNGVAFGNDASLMYVGSFEGDGVYKVTIPSPGAQGNATVLAEFGTAALPPPKAACEGKSTGDSCVVTTSQMGGTCEKLANVLDCVPSGDGCTEEFASCTLPGGEQGTCSRAFGILACSQADPCLGLDDGATCTMSGQTGTCNFGFCDAGGVISPPGDGGVAIPSGGGIDGLGVDACGNVYASQYTTGNLWRITAAGKTEKAATLPSNWVPNIKWGRGFGGFERQVMYVADRENQTLFAVKVGVEGATEIYDLGSK